MTILTDHFSALAPQYDIVLSDVWGVLHDGIAAFPEVCDALQRFRQGGGTVILLTNAPRRSDAVLHQIRQFGVPDDAHDGIATSGDVTSEVMTGRAGQSVFHLGPSRDLSVFKGLDIELAPLEKADYVVCTGLLDDEEHEDPEYYRDMLTAMRERELFMLCGNPDVVVHRGDQLFYCAGALADLYQDMGGEVLYAGKPYAPIYDLALGKAQAARSGKADRRRILAIGDSLRTDLRGAADYGIDCLFVTAGIHADELGGRDNPDPEAIERALAQSGLAPVAITRRVRW